MRASVPVLRLATLSLLLGCGGGGGGGTPLTSPPKLLVSGAQLAVGESRGELEIGVATEGDGPVLVQLDLRTDPDRIRLTPAPVPLQGDARSGPLAPGRYRLLLGDTRTARSPQTLATGTVARIPFEVLVPGQPAVVEVFAEAVLAADADGKTASIDAPRAPALIEIR